MPDTTFMSYETAPATLMLATHCAICGRALVDAKSVEIGIGPDCRKKYGYSEVMGLDEETRTQANKLIYIAAANQGGDASMESCVKLAALGCLRIVAAIVERIAVVKVATEAGRIGVKAPYSETATVAFRAVPGRLWDKERKINTFPVTSKAALFGALQEAFPNAIAVSEKGLFRIAPQAQVWGLQKAVA